jgi:hypothetical protein
MDIYLHVVQSGNMQMSINYNFIHSFHSTSFCGPLAMSRAAGNVVQWLHENRQDCCTTWAMDWASRNGHLDVVQ